ncbi:MAG TPA: acetylxylan esterase [Jiangellaceae bacterium]|nr:acetylxylan esterase [Jiangellaceae bacterium]
MPQFDLPLDELTHYRPEPSAEPDFDQFWTETLELARQYDLAPAYTPSDFLLDTVEVYDASFAGWNGERIAAWLLLPRDRPGPLPAVVQLIGYGGGRSLPYQHLLMSSAGYAHLVMDSRGQGGASYPGVTPDPDPASSTGQHPGFMTRGVSDPRTYYFRRIITDAVRAVEAARAHPVVDSGRVAVYGNSQGGGLALATAALAPDVSALLAHVPFLCDYRRAITITDAMPYKEIANYLAVRRDRVAETFRTLSYFDGVNFAARATAPSMFSVALMDEVCPPSTIYAAHNNYAGPKEIRVWPYNGHEGGEVFQNREDLAFLRTHLG